MLISLCGRKRGHRYIGEQEIIEVFFDSSEIKYIEITNDIAKVFLKESFFEQGDRKKKWFYLEVDGAEDIRVLQKILKDNA